MDQDTYQAILDSVKSPIVFVDNGHIIQYLNRSAKVRYYEISAKQITEAHERLQNGENEVYLDPDKNHEKVTVIVGVRDVGGILLGYYARPERQNRIQLNAMPYIS